MTIQVLQPIKSITKIENKINITIFDNIKKNVDKLCLTCLLFLLYHLINIIIWKERNKHEIKW